MKDIHFYDVETMLWSGYEGCCVNDMKHRISNEQGDMVLKSGITDTAPPEEFELRAGISPKFDEATQTWEELTEALEAYKAENAQPVEPDTLSIEELTTMIMTASTIGEVQDQILVRRYGVSPEPVPTST